MSETPAPPLEAFGSHIGKQMANGLEIRHGLFASRKAEPFRLKGSSIRFDGKDMVGHFRCMRLLVGADARHPVFLIGPENDPNGSPWLSL